MSLQADTPIQFVKGVGPARAALFQKAGVQTVHDLLHYFPFRHEHDTGEVAIEEVHPGEVATIRGEVVRLGGRFPGLTAEVDDGTGVCILRWFNRNYGGQRVFRGATVIATGKIDVYGDLPQIVQPRLQVYEQGAVLMGAGRGARLFGVYRGSGELKTGLIRRTILAVLAQATLPIDEVLPAGILKSRGLMAREAAIRTLHVAESEAALKRARDRLAYEELFLLELAMGLRRQRRLALVKGRKIDVTPEIDARIRARFPFVLTRAQDAAVSEIASDLRSGRPMSRLLQGDVGSGKTCVALYACLAAIACRRQAAIMAPTEILAEQHFRNIERYLEGSRVRFRQLRGGGAKAPRAAAVESIERGEVDLVVGTQALIQKDVAFRDLALVVVDEQHKFGVLQRHTFRTKGPQPHYLVMTATPIPRTLGMTVFGDLDVSIIRQSPPGRGKIVTKVVPEAKWDTVMGYVRKRLESGEQAYVVCPAIGKDSTEDESAVEPSAAKPAREPRTGDGESRRRLVTVAAEYDRLTRGPWAGIPVGLLHGAMRSREKDGTITAFREGKFAALVSTTVVEVGVDVPNATIMVVEQAERYGLAQLHQLRGRVGRGGKDSLCVLIHGPDAIAKGAKRLGVMARTTDGFEIAEADLRHRGPGELLGTRQHGLPDFQIADLVGDGPLLEQAREDAFACVDRGIDLRSAEARPLTAALKRLLGETLALVDVA